MKKRIALLLMLGVVLVVLTGCGGGSSTDEVVEQAKTYDVVFSVMNQAETPINDVELYVNDEKLTKQGDYYSKKLTKGTHSFSVKDQNDRYFNYSSDFTISENEKRNIYLYGKINQNYNLESQNKNYILNFNYPYDWEYTKSNNIIEFKLKDTEFPYYRIVFLEMTNAFDDSTLKEYIEYLKSDESSNTIFEDNVLLKEGYINVDGRLAYEGTLEGDNTKLKLLVGYYKDTTYQVFYKDNSSVFDYNIFIYEGLRNSLKAKEN